MMTDDDIFRMYVKYRLNSVYGSGSCPDCSVKAENESLKTELQKLEKMKRDSLEWDHDMLEKRWQEVCGRACLRKS